MTERPVQEWTPLVRRGNAAAAIWGDQWADAETYGNARFVVVVRPVGCDGQTHLAIRRRGASGPLPSREDIQHIKDELVGADVDAVELYPARCRTVPNADLVHLWVMPKGQPFPLGHDEHEDAS